MQTSTTHNTAYMARPMKALTTITLLSHCKRNFNCRYYYHNVKGSLNCAIIFAKYTVDGAKKIIENIAQTLPWVSQPHERWKMMKLIAPNTEITISPPFNKDLLSDLLEPISVGAPISLKYFSFYYPPSFPLIVSNKLIMG